MDNEKLIYEKVYVETPVDTDGDGLLDLIVVYVMRPKTEEKVPAVYVANPYMLSCNEDWYDTHNVDLPVQIYPNQTISKEDITWQTSCHQPPHCTTRVTCGYAESAPCDPPEDLECISSLYEHLRGRGYASVFSGGLGTVGSDGLVKTGSHEEVLAFEAVIHWLNGRCRGFTNKTDGIEVKANWCTGNVAMSAKSYLGSLAVGVATTGVEGLKTIIPEAAISNWYEYYHYNGLNLPAYEWQGDDVDLLAKYCFSRAKDPEDFAKVKAQFEQCQGELEAQADRVSSNYNRFWDERNYLNRASNIKASVLSIHGINDWNVKTSQCINLFHALEEYGVEHKMILHQGEHIYIYQLKDFYALDIIDRWLDYYLKGIDTGIQKEPKVWVQSNLDQAHWYTSDTFPPSNCEVKNFKIPTGDKEYTITDTLDIPSYQEQGVQGWRDQLVLADHSDNRVKFVWDVFQGRSETKVRLSGQVVLSFEAALDQETAILSAMLVDVGEDCRLTAEQITDPDGAFSFGREVEPSPYKIISRGWLNAQNRTNSYCKEAIEKHQYHTYTIPMIATDHTIQAGHKLALILYGIDPDYTQRPQTTTHITVKEASISATIPLVY